MAHCGRPRQPDDVNAPGSRVMATGRDDLRGLFDFLAKAASIAIGMVLTPVVGDILPTANPHPIMLLNVVEETL